MDVAYTDANPPGLDINRLATQEELLRLWWSKTPSMQLRWIVGEEIPRAANIQYDELPILPMKYQSSLDPTGRPFASVSMFDPTGQTHVALLVQRDSRKRSLSRRPITRSASGGSHPKC